MAYYVVDPQEYEGVANIESDLMRLRQDIHCLCFDISELKQTQNSK